jgi:hypothetical protein
MGLDLAEHLLRLGHGAVVIAEEDETADVLLGHHGRQIGAVHGTCRAAAAATPGQEQLAELVVERQVRQIPVDGRLL